MSARASTDVAERGSARASLETQQVTGGIEAVTVTEESEGTKFQQAIAAWRNINLSQLVPTLDSVASDLASNQRDALVERKELAQKTKDFRKLDDAIKIVEIKGLLKAYQTYIDLIASQSKTVSAAFFQIYSPLSEAPDPYPLLETSVESLVVADETVPRLEAENKQLQSANENLTKQLEETEHRLEEERTARKGIEEVQDTRMQEIEATWSAVLTEKQDNWESREKNLEEKVDNQERLLKELKASYEVSQRLDRGEGADERGGGGASLAELEIVSSDLERTSARLADVESRNEQLRLELAQSAASKMTNTYPANPEDDVAFQRLRSENSSLLRRAESVKLEHAVEKRALDGTLRNLKKEISALQADCISLRAKVTKWSDYDELRKELEILKSIEFATGDAEDDENPTNEITAADSATAGPGQKDDEHNLEHLLMSRNKKLNNELTILRVSHQDLASRLELLQENLSNTNMELERSRNLNATLENDLSRVQNEINDAQPAMSVAGTFTSRYPASSLRRGRRPSPTSSIISGMDGGSSSNVLESLRASEAAGGGASSGILPMITAQRDRFKKRISDLETELTKTYQTVTSLRTEVANLQKDNVNLYEKTRYTSTYNSNGKTLSSNSIGIGEGGAGNNDPVSPLDRYRSAYESRISPFAAFRGRESARALKRMRLPERMLFQLMRMVLHTRTSRNVFALYLLALHIFVFSVVWPGAGRAGGGMIPEGMASSSSAMAGGPDFARLSADDLSQVAGNAAGAAAAADAGAGIQDTAPI